MQLTFEREKIPLSAPFTITGYTFTDITVIVARIGARGATGQGEAAGVYYLGDDADRMAADIERVRHDVESGCDREALRRLLPPGGARNALDCALWDLEAKRLGQPVWRIAGLERPRPLPTTFTIPANDPGAMAAKAVEYAQARSLKLKLTGELALDAERVRAVRRARPDTWLGVATPIVSASTSSTTPAAATRAASAWTTPGSTTPSYGHPNEQLSVTVAVRPSARARAATASARSSPSSTVEPAFWC